MCYSLWYNAPMLLPATSRQHFIDINRYHKTRPGTVGVVARPWDGKAGFGGRPNWIELPGAHHGCRRLSLRVKVRYVKLTIHVCVVPN